jgi:DNA-binding transcriptional LysR family regulator
VVPEDHRLAGLPEVSAVELRDDPFVLATAGPGTLRSMVEEACARAGYAPREVTDVPDISGVLALVAAGVAIGFTMSSSRVLTPAGMTMIPLTERVEAQTLLVWRAGHETKALENVLALARAIFPTTDR